MFDGSDFTMLYTYMMFRHDMIVEKKLNRKKNTMLTAQFEGASEQCLFLSYYVGEGLKKKTKSNHV